MHSPLPLTRDVVLIGGGHTHALVLRRWGMKPLPGARLTLINPAPTAPYTGMLPGYVAGHYPRRALEIDLVRLARFAGARLILGAATGIDRTTRHIRITGHADVSYDIAAIDIGITTDLPMLDGFVEHAVGAKPLGVFAARWDAFLGRIAAGACPATVAIIGGGVAGVELALAMMHRMRTQGATTPEVTVLEATSEALTGIGAPARAALLRHMERMGITLKTGVTVSGVTPGAVVLNDGTVIDAQLTVGAAGARPHGWLKDTGLDLHEGFLTVDPQLRTVTDPAIYATGDCAHMAHDPRPKAGVFAVRQAPVLYDNLRADLTGRQRRSYRPQGGYLKLISTGGKGAVADKFGLWLDGGWLWAWKDRIDHKFMEKFETFPKMPTPEIPPDLANGVAQELAGGAPLCGGCGSKVGGADLAAVLSALPEPRRSDVLSRPGDDAAVLTHGDGQQVLTTDHLRAFMGDPYRMARIAAVHALGDIWAMGASPQAALASVILPRMTAPLQAETLREIMQAATEVFRDAGADVVGGHTSLGSELTIGFTVTGLTKGRAVRHSGARAGDVLILTKPIGSGTILAAEMQGKANGEWVADCYDVMEHPMGKAAAILAPAAHAMTDVTGFGLAGHLGAMMTGSGTSATLVLNDIPLMMGAEELAQSGIRSTIWPANRAASGWPTLPDTPRAALLFDPQTAGGLLASVPAHAVAAVLSALADAGETGVVIGTVDTGDTAAQAVNLR